MKLNDLTIVVCCNSQDFFLARICIASIRYYYPEIPIELVKDYGKGSFSSNNLEKYFNVKNINLGVKKMGWSAAKFLYLYKMPKGKKVLLLDADIAFVGPFLERIIREIETDDYVVSIDKESNPYSDFVTNTYFVTKNIESAYPDYKFPGYLFNAGAVFVTVGAIPKEILDEFFDETKYPFWKNFYLFSLVDQSVYNYLLPTLASKNQLKLGTQNFMLWSNSEIAKALNLDNIKSGTLKTGLIHWAGEPKSPSLTGMSRKDILMFFQDYYYKRIPLPWINKTKDKVVSDFLVWSHTFKRKASAFTIKKALNKINNK